MKSMVPAIFVRRPSLGKRVIAWMPERPAVTADQLSAWPWPREVTTPMPVTATSGRPCASRIALSIKVSSGRLHQADETLAALVADRRHHSFARLAAGDQG